jgi:lipopolysaccharide transport system permease protein
MELIIKPKNKWWHTDFKEIWRFRELAYFFAWRDFKVKYKQTVVGVLWVVFQPFVTMVVFTVFFGNLAKMPSDNIPYPIFVFTGLLFWTLFSNSLSNASNSFTANEGIITKIYFPKIIIAVASVVTNLVDFVVAAAILVVMMVFYHYVPSFTGILIIPLLVIMTTASSVGIGLLLASLNVKYRDIRYILPFFIQLLIFITPVIYPVSIVSPENRWILGLNPMAGIISAARSGLLGGSPIDWTLLGISALSMALYCVIGFFYFRLVEKYFADVI